MLLGGVKKCARCDKQVYPVEEWKCLDKTWHKMCFKCTVCGMVLNMKNYKGFEKQPYCATHYPQQKHTAVADNPEIQRIKENTKLQSNAKYHEDFEKSKGSYIAVTNDLEINRVMENQKLVSGVEYKQSKNRDSSSSLSQHQANKSNTNSMISNTVTYKAGEKQADVQQVPKKIGSIADYDPLANDNDFRNNKFSTNSYKQTEFNTTTTTATDKPGLDLDKLVKNKTEEEDNLKNTVNECKTTIYKAIYDHDANEDDEISFRDGDRFLECQIVDVGWMVGIHEKSKKFGLFPSNYVEPIETL